MKRLGKYSCFLQVNLAVNPFITLLQLTARLHSDYRVDATPPPLPVVVIGSAISIYDLL